MKKPNPMPIITYDGQAYKLRSRKTEIPDLESMDRLAALIWLNRNTTARGYYKAPDPLIGMGGVISIKEA